MLLVEGRGEEGDKSETEGGEGERERERDKGEEGHESKFANGVATWWRKETEHDPVSSLSPSSSCSLEERLSVNDAVMTLSGLAREWTE